METTSKFGNVVGAKFIDSGERSRDTSNFFEQTDFFKESNSSNDNQSTDSESKDSGAFKTTSFFS